MEEKSEKSVFYVHGKKGAYLGKRYNLLGVDMDVSIISLKSNINFPKFFLSNIFSRNIFSSFSKDFIVGKMVDECVSIQMGEWGNHSSKKIDVIVGSSWGGTLVLEMMAKYPESFSPSQKFLLISPAHGKMFSKYTLTEAHTKRFSNVKVLHSVEDSTVPFSESERICKEAGWEMLRIEGDDHGMYDLLKDYKKGSLFDVIEKWEPEVVNEECEKNE